MFRRCFFVMVILLVGLSSGAYCASGSISITKLENGLKVIVREGHAVNLVAVDVWVKAGSVNEDSSNSGVAHFCEHMVFKATKKFGLGEIDREMEGVGAEVNGGTSKDYVHFYTTVASEYLQTALDVLADAVMNAQFHPEDLEKERQVVLDEIARSDSDPLKVAVNIFARTAYVVHPYGRMATGTQEAVKKLKRDDLAAYYAKYFTPANTCVSIAGDVTKQDAVASVLRAFGGFEQIHPNAAGNSQAPPAEPARTAPLIRRYTWNQSSKSYIVFGFFASPASEVKDVCALDSMLAIFGDTYRGRISTALTGAGVHFSAVATDYVTQRYPGLFYVLVAVDPADEEKAASVILTEYRRIATEPVGRQELADAKARVEGADLYDQETFSGQARFLGLWESIASYDVAINRTPTIRSLTIADIASCAKEYFSGDDYCLVTLEPGKLH